MIFENFPYSNFHDINLDWILKTFREMEKQLDEFVFLNTIKYADPIQWNITTQYAKNTIVIDPATGDAYISVQAVPAGVPITNSEYWSVIFNYQAVINTIKENIAVDAGNSPTTPVALDENDLVWWNNDLYKVLYDIAAGTAFIEGVNVRRMTVDEKIEDLYNKTAPYPIYYPSQELAVFSGSIGTGEIVEVSGDVHYYNEDTQTMTIVHND